MQNPTPKYKRVLLKLSGEALMGPDQFGINRATLSGIVQEIKSMLDLGVELGVVVGGGNIFHGRLHGYACHGHERHGLAGRAAQCRH